MPELNRVRRLYRMRTGHSGDVQSGARAATPTACFSTIIRRSPAGASCGAFRKSSPSRRCAPQIDTLVGTLDYGPVRIATGTMGYKHKSADLAAVKASLLAPNFLLKIMPHVDGTPRICEIVEYYLEDIDLKGAWTGPAALTSLRMHWRQWPNYRCSRSCPESISSPTSRLASARSCTTIWPERPGCVSITSAIRDAVRRPSLKVDHAAQTPCRCPLWALSH